MIFFIRQYQKQLQKKWKSLPLLLLFPILIISLCFFVLVSLFIPDEEQPIHVGLVDLDQSDETTMLVGVIDDASLLGSYIHINNYSEQEAIRALEDGIASAYITFPENFTSDLYTGKSVEVPIVGNPDKPVESYIIKELIDSMTRYIASAQANILTIDHYASQLPIADDERQEMLLQQFNEFMLFTLSKDKVIKEEEIMNKTTSAPVQYYSLSGWFILSTIWILCIYILLGKTEGTSMWNRMRLYGVTILQRIISRILISMFYGFILAMLGFLLFVTIMDIEFYLIDYGRISLLISLFFLIFLLGLSLMDIVINSNKFSLLIQITYTGIVLFMSGAVIPSLYFPESVKVVLPYLFSTETFHWLIEVAMEGRLYVDYSSLFISFAISLVVLIVISMWKERGQS
ncbi:ABC transporter permease [Aquibacillus halophilus]|nr:ABC transporter permease [Aquibacillus halophilus]